MCSGVDGLVAAKAALKVMWVIASAYAKKRERYRLWPSSSFIVPVTAIA
jgi:hypothetical protein